MAEILQHPKSVPWLWIIVSALFFLLWMGWLIKYYKTRNSIRAYKLILGQEVKNDSSRVIDPDFTGYLDECTTKCLRSENCLGFSVDYLPGNEFYNKVRCSFKNNKKPENIIHRSDALPYYTMSDTN